MSDRDSTEQMSEEVEGLLERASSPDSAPAEVRDRVWSKVSETVGADLDADPGDAGDGGSSTAPGTDSPPSRETGAESGVSTAGSGGLGQALGGAGLVQTAVTFLVGTAVGAGGYALLRGDPTEPRSDRQVVAENADTGPSADAGTDAGHLDTATPDTVTDDTLALETSAENDEKDETVDRSQQETAPSPSRDESSDPRTDRDEPSETSVDTEPPADRSQPSVDDTPDAESGTDSTLSEERVLLSRAQSALARNRPDEALEALNEHEQRFAEGELLEERRALLVRALLRTDRRDEARRRAREFLETYPNSIFREIVTPAVDEIDGE